MAKYCICVTLLVLVAVSVNGADTSDRAARVDAAIAYAAELDQGGDWQKAVRVLEGVVRGRPFDWPSKAGSCPAEWSAYEPLGAILLRERPDDSMGRLYAGIALAIKGDYEQARVRFVEGAEADSKSADLQFALGWALLRVENAASASPIHADADTSRKALEQFERALALDPNHIHALNSAAYTCLRLAYGVSRAGDYTLAAKVESRLYLIKAAQYLERMDKIAGQSARHETLLMDIYQQTGDRAAFLRHREQAAKLKAIKPDWPVGTATFTFYDGSRFVTKPLAKLRVEEREAGAGGHMPWRAEPAMVASVFLASQATDVPLGGATDTREGPWVKRSVKTKTLEVTFEVVEQRGNRADVAVRVDGKPYARVRLERPAGGWWYVTSWSAAPVRG